MSYSDDVRQPLLGAGRAEKTDSLAPPSYTAFASAAAAADDVEDGPGEAFFSSPAGGVPERAGFLSFLLPGRRGSHHHYYHYYQQGPPAPARCARRHRRSCCRSLCMHLCCFVLLALVALYAGGVSLGLISGGFRFLRPHGGGDSGSHHNNDDLPPLAPGTPDAPAHTLPSHPAPPARVTLPPPSPSAPLAGALFLPGRQCQAHNGGKTITVIPSTAYDVVFDQDARLAVEQNVTRWSPDAAAAALDPLDADVAEAVVGQLRRVPVQVYGDVVVRAGARAAVEIEALANDERIHAQASFDARGQHLAVTVDDGVWESVETAPGKPATDPWPCLVVRATVWVPPAADPAAVAAALRALDVSAVHLGVVVADDVKLAVRDAVHLSSVVGDVDGHYDVSADKPSTKDAAAAGGAGFIFDAPKVILASTSGHIHGLWARRNRLVASTASGDIAVAVRALPRAEHHDDDNDDDDDKDHQGLGTVVLDSMSGSIDLRESAASDPAAPPHRLVVSTKSGAITGDASFAMYAGLHTLSGAIAPRLAAVRWPAVPAIPGVAIKPHQHAFLGTDTVSGATDLTVTTTAHDGPLDFLRSNHRAVSGAVTLLYPASWAGHIELVSRFGGSVAVHGDNVVELPSGPHGSPFGHRIAAVKDLAAGAPASNITAATVSGAVDLSF